MSKCLSADHLLAFLKDEAAERLSARKPSDGPLQTAEDNGFLEALETVAAHIEWALERAA